MTPNETLRNAARGPAGDVDRRMTSGTIACRAASSRGTAGGSTRELAGYAAVFNVETVIAGMFREKILPGAFADSMREDDIVGLFNHDANFVLGRTANRTVRLAEDRKGLKYEIDLNPEDPEAVRIGALVGRGDVRGSSFAFSVQGDDDDEWVQDDPAKLPLRIVKRARLWDVSPVTMPAYPTTTVSANTAQRAAAAAGVPLDVLQRELELDALELEVFESASWRDQAPRPRRVYAPGELGVLERELELVDLEAGT